MAMTNAAKLSLLMTLLHITDPTTEDETTLNAYLTLAGKEIIAWRYSYADPATAPAEVPDDLEVTQVFAVVNGYNQQGGEGQSMHSENNLYLTFSYADMVAYIHRNVIPYVKVV